MGQSFDLLPLPERARRYREMARVACDLAAKGATLESKADYLRLAAAWQDLALTLQSEMEAEEANTSAGRGTTHKRSAGEP
jgi:hypothetical protein